MSGSAPSPRWPRQAHRSPSPAFCRSSSRSSGSHKAPTLFLAGEADRLTPLAGLYELFDRTPSRKQMYILREAGHYHFGDEIDEYDLCSRQDAHCFTRSLTLAHFDAALKHNRDAEHFMQDQAVALLQARGVNVVAYMDGE